MGLLNLYCTAGRIDNQMITTLTDRSSGAVSDNRDIAAVGLDILLILSGRCADQTCNRRNHRDLNAAILACRRYLIDCKIGRRGGIFTDRDIRRRVVRSDNIAIGFCKHVPVRHIEAEIAVSIFADDQISRSAIADLGGGRASGDTGISYSQVRCVSILRQIPVSSLHIHTDFRSQSLQPDLLTIENRNGRIVVHTGCDCVKNLVGFCHTQRNQHSIPNLRKNLAQPHVHLSTIVDHAVYVIAKLVFLLRITGGFVLSVTGIAGILGIFLSIEFVAEFPFLTQITEVFGCDIVGFVHGAIKHGRKCHNAVFNDQVEHQTTIFCLTVVLCQIEGIGDPIARCCFFCPAVFWNRHGFDGNIDGLCILSCHRPVNGQHCVATRIDAARTNHQNTGAQILVCNIAVDRKWCGIIAASGDFTAGKRCIILVGKNLYTGGFLENSCVAGKVCVVAICAVRIGNIVCYAVEQLTFLERVLVVIVSRKLMGGFVDNVQIHVLVHSLVVQCGSGIILCGIQ